MEKFSIREVVEQAVQTERLGREFYSRMSSKFRDDEKLKQLFDTLALKELEHEHKFSEMKENIGDEMMVDWDEAAQYLRAIVESEFFLGKNKALPSMENLNSPGDAVNYALRFEKETLLYYHGLKDSVKDQDVLNEIINEEKSHIRWLSEYRKSL